MNRIYYSETRSFALKEDTKCASGLNSLTQNLAPLTLIGTYLVRNLTRSPDTLTKFDSVVTMANTLVSCVFIYLLTYLLTPIQQNPSRQANPFSASQKIPHILCNPKVHYRIHKCPSPVFILGLWASSVQSIPPHPTS